MPRELSLEGRGVKSHGDWVRNFGVTHAVMVDMLFCTICTFKPRETPVEKHHLVS
jgi:hypothetical protein